jgi:hypothetical protein
VFDACCSKRWQDLRCVAAHRSTCIKRAAAFILVFVQAAAAARVAGGPGILKSAKIGDGVSVLCHLIADTDGVTANHSIQPESQTKCVWFASKEGCGYGDRCRLRHDVPAAPTGVINKRDGE